MFRTFSFQQMRLSSHSNANLVNSERKLGASLVLICIVHI